MTTVTPGSEDTAVTATASSDRAQQRGLARLTTPPRITALDAARGIAVVGMISAHVLFAESFEWGQISTWADVANGRSSILFAVIAGVSLALMTGGRHAVTGESMRSARLRLLGRGAAVFGLGLLLELLNTGIAVILTVYGLLFIAAIPFLGIRRRTLGVLISIGALCGPALLALLQVFTLFPWGEGLGLVVFGTYPITVWMTFVLSGLLIGRSDLTRLRVQLVMLISGSVLCAVGYGAAAATESVLENLWKQMDPEFADLYDAEPSIEGWEYADSDDWYSIVSPEEIDFSSLECEVYAEDDWITCAPEGELSGISWEDDKDWYDEDEWYGEGLTWSEYVDQVREAAPLVAAGMAVLDSSPHSGGTAEILGSGGLAVALLGLLLLIGRISALRWVMLPMAALGSMPLTAYCAHVVLYGVMLSWLGMGSVVLAWGIQIGALVAAALVWTALWGSGPLERLVAAVARRADTPHRGGLG